MSNSLITYVNFNDQVVNVYPGSPSAYLIANGLPHVRLETPNRIEQFSEKFRSVGSSLKPGMQVDEISEIFWEDTYEQVYNENKKSVEFPLFEGTAVSVRRAEEAKCKLPVIFDFLRTSGYTEISIE